MVEHSRQADLGGVGSAGHADVKRRGAFESMRGAEEWRAARLVGVRRRGRFEPPTTLRRGAGLTRRVRRGCLSHPVQMESKVPGWWGRSGLGGQTLRPARRRGRQPHAIAFGSEAGDAVQQA